MWWRNSRRYSRGTAGYSLADLVLERDSGGHSRDTAGYSPADSECKRAGSRGSRAGFSCAQGVSLCERAVTSAETAVTVCALTVTLYALTLRLSLRARSECTRVSGAYSRGTAGYSLVESSLQAWHRRIHRPVRGPRAPRTSLDLLVAAPLGPVAPLRRADGVFPRSPSGSARSARAFARSDWAAARADVGRARSHCAAARSRAATPRSPGRDSPPRAQPMKHSRDAIQHRVGRFDLGGLRIAPRDRHAQRGARFADVSR